MTSTTICPTVTATNTHEYREQMERISGFAKRIHIDLMDGQFAPTVSPPLSHVWWPDTVTADIHLMYAHPEAYLETLIQLKPHMVIVPAEVAGDMVAFAAQLHAQGIACGVALLAPTEVDTVSELVAVADQVLIFSGKLGYHGGMADLSLLRKVADIRTINQTAEIAWDGGVDDSNADQIARAGVSVLNVGGYIQHGTEPDAEAAYAILGRKVETLA